RSSGGKTEAKRLGRNGRAARPGGPFRNKARARAGGGARGGWVGWPGESRRRMSADVDRVVEAGDPADHGPMFDIVARHEQGAGRPAQGEDIQPGHVVGREQDMVLEWRALDSHAQAGPATDIAEEDAGPGGAANEQLPQE